MPKISLKIDSEEFIRQRLDKYISSIPNGITRSRLKSGIKTIHVNGMPAKLSKILSFNDKIEIEWEDPLPEHIIPENIPLDILYEDKNVTVVNKAQNIVTHPASGNWNGTLVNALLFHWKKEALLSNDTQSFRSGIVHRLDKDTSGVIITARNRESELWLQNQFKNRRVKKEYIAIVIGHPPAKQGSIKTRIVRSTRNRKIFTCTEDKNKGKFSHTVYSCVAVYGNYSLLRLILKTGRTHQIRVHLKHLGCPIVGDSVYGKKDSFFNQATLMLHSRKLGILLPNEEEFHTFLAPTPKRFVQVMKLLKQQYEKQFWNF